MTVKALLIIDVQNAILTGKAAKDRQPLVDGALNETVARLRTLQEAARLAGAPVILVQHDGEETHRLAVGTPGWEIREELAPQDGDMVVRKTSADSFHQTALQQCLAQRNIDHLVVGGCMSQYCVDTTVRRAVSLGYDVTLISDGHMTGDSGTLSYAQIVSHHNETLNGFNAGRFTVTVRPTAEIVF